MNLVLIHNPARTKAMYAIHRAGCRDIAREGGYPEPIEDYMVSEAEYFGLDQPVEIVGFQLIYNSIQDGMIDHTDHYAVREAARIRAEDVKAHACTKN